MTPARPSPPHESSRPSQCRRTTSRLSKPAPSAHARKPVGAPSIPRIHRNSESTPPPGSGPPETLPATLPSRRPVPERASTSAAATAAALSFRTLAIIPDHHILQARLRNLDVLHRKTREQPEQRTHPALHPQIPKPRRLLNHLMTRRQH